MRWPEDLTDWPMSEHSRQVLCRPHRWHLQESGSGPTVLLIHGAGGATQSWRGLFPRLANHFHVVAIDLPGQGFTECGARARLGLEATATDLESLISSEGFTPWAIIGHSAGAAIGLQMARTHPVHVIGINAALSNFQGVAGWLFPMMAKALSLNPLSARLFAKTATSGSIRNLIHGTGSKLDPKGIALYLRLARDANHVDATLGMMAQWSLDALNQALPDITSRVDLITSSGDKAVPPSSSRAAVEQLPNAFLHELQGYGHLVHEESPDQIHNLICKCLQAA